MREVYIKLLNIPRINVKGYYADGEPTVYGYCYAELKSATRSEFYAAMAAGQRTDAVFKVRLGDYSTKCNAVELEDGTRYTIIRTYEIDRDYIELTAAFR